MDADTAITGNGGTVTVETNPERPNARKLSKKASVQMITLIAVFAYDSERQTPKPKQSKRKEQP
jgi:hypothetical protein